MDSREEKKPALTSKSPGSPEIDKKVEFLFKEFSDEERLVYIRITDLDLGKLKLNILFPPQMSRVKKDAFEEGYVALRKPNIGTSKGTKGIDVVELVEKDDPFITVIEKIKSKALEHVLIKLFPEVLKSMHFTLLESEKIKVIFSAVPRNEKELGSFLGVFGAMDGKHYPMDEEKNIPFEFYPPPDYNTFSPPTGAISYTFEPNNIILKVLINIAPSDPAFTKGAVQGLRKSINDSDALQTVGIFLKRKEAANLSTVNKAAAEGAAKGKEKERKKGP